jgi:membrane protein DedA with SNARE-associated domain
MHLNVFFFIALRIPNLTGNLFSFYVGRKRKKKEMKKRRKREENRRNKIIEAEK